MSSSYDEIVVQDAQPPRPVPLEVEGKPKKKEKKVVNMNSNIIAALTVIVICLSVALASISIYINTNKSTRKTKYITTTEFATKTPPSGDNICSGAKVVLPNIDCINETIGALEEDRFALGTAEQSGVNVTKGYQGDYDVDTVPITNSYWQEGMCPVNVHWHLGTEHLSKGEYDEDGTGPTYDHVEDDHDSEYGRRLEGEVRAGFQCHYYNENDPKFTKEYDWQWCVDMHVGETYEVHWPHSNMGACGTLNQFQTNFYDGVFCTFATTFNGSLTGAKIGVQGQVFTIVNDEDYYYPDLMHGAIVDGEMWEDVAKYTGSTTGTSRDNDICSQYTGITWQVDRKCHMISASSFDKMCADMKSQRDDMSPDFHPHGSRELVEDHLAADNHHKLRKH